MQIAVIGAGFSPGEADRLRRSMATFKRTGGVTAFREKFISGMLDVTCAREMFEHFAGHTSPPSNIIGADRHGSIGYKLIGRLPKYVLAADSTP